MSIKRKTVQSRNIKLKKLLQLLKLEGKKIPNPGKDQAIYLVIKDKSSSMINRTKRRRRRRRRRNCLYILY